MKTNQLAVAATAVGVGICSAVLAIPLATHAAGPVANYLLAPSPIAAPATLPANATVTVTLTAVNSTNTPVPGATVFLTFKHTVTGGGSALVGTTALTIKPQSFVTDTGGHIAVTYKTPATLPANGEDLIGAQNLASHPTIRVTDHYTFDKVARYKMSSTPDCGHGVPSREHHQDRDAHSVEQQSHWRGRRGRLSALHPVDRRGVRFGRDHGVDEHAAGVHGQLQRGSSHHLQDPRRAADQRSRHDHGEECADAPDRRGQR